MGRRHELTDAAWATIGPLMPRDPRRGQRWRDVPARYGPWQTLHAPLLRWRRDGTWAKILRHVQQL